MVLQLIVNNTNTVINTNTNLLQMFMIYVFILFMYLFRKATVHIQKKFAKQILRLVES